MKKVLFVEDEVDLRDFAAFRMRKSGYDVVTAANGKEALDIIQNNPVGLVLLDLSLPVMDGASVCKHLKADDKLKQIPVVIFTASVASIEDKVREIGADDYLIKPFESEDLIEKVKKFIGQAEPVR